MGIRFYCPNGHKMNVKSYLAGKIGFCPECGARMQIPYEDTRPSSKALKDAGVNPATHPTAAPANTANEILSETSPGGIFASNGTADTPADSPTTLPSETSGNATTPVPVPISPEPTALQTAPSIPPGVNPLLTDNTLVWYLHIPGGTQYGPVASEVVATWIRERRIAPDMLVWREDWPEWKEAKAVFPEVLQY